LIKRYFFFVSQKHIYILLVPTGEFLKIKPSFLAILPPILLFIAFAVYITLCKFKLCCVRYNAITSISFSLCVQIKILTELVQLLHSEVCLLQV